MKKASCIKYCFKAWAIIIIQCICFSSHAQTITLYAGRGTIAGDGIPATAVSLNFPNAIAFDRAGNVLITESGGERVRKVDAAGIITTVAGTGVCCGFTGDGGPATAAQFNALFDLRVDGIGNIYISDVGNHRIRKVDTFGIITTVAGNGSPISSGDGLPATAAGVPVVCIGVDKAGNIFVATSDQIRKVTASTGIITTVIGLPTSGYTGDGGPASAAQFNLIRGVSVDKIGNIYIVDEGNACIRKVDTFGIVRTVAGNGTPGFSGDGMPATTAQLDQPEEVFVDDAENMYIADRYNERVRKVNTLGIITTIAGMGPVGVGAYGGDGGPATAAQFAYLRDMAKQGGGNIFIADRNNGCVRMITDTNHAVYFTGGHILPFNVCAASVSIDTLLSAADIDTSQLETWGLIYGPFHGSVSASYTTYSTRGTLIPTGLTYTPTPGYIGFDTFKVQVTDGYTADTTTVYARVDTTLPYAGGITGVDTVCVGHSIVLNDTITGGVWSSLSAKATVSSGMVTGISSGADTIRYAVTNGCGTAIATYSITVKGCLAGVASPLQGEEVLRIFPNPNNGAFTLLLSSPTDEEAQMIITNLVGEKVKEITATTNKPTEILLNTPSGIYFLNAVTAHGVWSGKVVVN